MAEKHSPEPWIQHGHINRVKYVCKAGCDETSQLSEIATIFAAHEATSNGREQISNARRIVAAVNSVAGIPTEALESGVVADALEAAAEALMLLRKVEPLLRQPKEASDG